MALITSVRARTVNIPLEKAVAISTRNISNRYYTLIRIGFDDNTEGIGVCQGGSTYGGLATNTVVGLLRPLLLGEDSYQTEKIWHKMYQDTLLNGRQGAVIRAISGIDFAIWDRNSKSHGLPLWKYLGGAHSDTVPAYASGGYYGPDRTVDDLVSEMDRYLEMGFRAIKIRVGMLSPAEDQQRVAAVRKVIGDAVPLMLDANNAWKDIPSALRTLRRLEQYEPFWIEEPFGPDDVANHAALREKISIPVATGELVSGRWAHQNLLISRAVDILQPDAGVCGGITEFRRVAAQACGFGIPIAPHSLQPIHIHLVAADTNALMLEFFTDSRTQPLREIIDRPLRLRDGRAVIPQDPGLGFEFRADKVEEFAVNNWS